MRILIQLAGLAVLSVGAMAPSASAQAPGDKETGLAAVNSDQLDGAPSASAQAPGNKQTGLAAVNSDQLDGAPSASAQAPGNKETGLAAVYSDKLDGHVTASGAIYHRDALTAAHKTLPFGTIIKATNEKNHRTVELTVNDRGPVQANRILNISPAAAAKLGFSKLSMREVTLEIVNVGDGKRIRRPTRP